ncbi:hypothetical protein ILYODFUR_019135 [Ilyodon furcidens]|uniref:Uncharacterized protein n=1 Tax=Ilyodon furcidens TaxID=33524 RepID=A0ABV0TVW6_9TELE
MESSVEGKSVVQKGALATGIIAALKIVRQNPFKSMHQDPLRTDEFYTWATSVIPGLRRKRTGLSSGNQGKVSISFGNQGPRVWRNSGEAQNPHCLKSSVRNDLENHVICWC